MPSIARHCPLCKKYAEVTITPGVRIICPHCQQVWGRADDLQKIFDQCPICQGRQFYLSKDFNQFLGCLVVILGIIFVPWTYGLSLPFFALIDWLLYKKVPAIVCCYKCGSEFRGFSIPSAFKPFLHHIGLKYDKYR